VKVKLCGRCEEKLLWKPGANLGSGEEDESGAVITGDRKQERTDRERRLDEKEVIARDHEETDHAAHSSRDSRKQSRQRSASPPRRERNPGR
jgi:hypothetical protein